MRSREKIVQNASYRTDKQGLCDLSLEVLLDIRDLLVEIRDLKKQQIYSNIIVQPPNYYPIIGNPDIPPPSNIEVGYGQPKTTDGGVIRWASANV